MFLGSMAMVSPRTPEVIWFESLDTYIHELQPSEMDQLKLSRPFNKEAERVRDWINTANKISKSYRSLAAMIKHLPIPESDPELLAYRNAKADWYCDVAGVFEDLTRPRTPPKTIEELDSQTDEIKDRAIELKRVSTKLSEMDMNLRKQYGVHADKHTDALTKYVNGR
jgi:hypothetical protein